MADATTVSNKPSKRIQWMWNSSADPFSTSPPVEWMPYSDVENMIIEEAFQADQIHAILDDYNIDFELKMQISNNDVKKQRPVKRMECNANDHHVRVERFEFTPIKPNRPFGGLYGWIPPFIKEAAENLKITKENLPSKDETVIPLIVEKAADGIIEEAKLIGKQREGEALAKELLETKEAGMKSVWECCAHLYTKDSFLFRRLNEIMRLIGSEEHEQDWRNKVQTLGPFCLLLWDNPFNYEATKTGTVLYRGATLYEEGISCFKDDSSKKTKPIRSFQSFCSCSRNPNVAEMYSGDTLFIMTIKYAFTMDLQPVSQYNDEEEELISPGVCFTVDRVEFDNNKNKHVIYLDLIQQHRRK